MEYGRAGGQPRTGRPNVAMPPTLLSRLRITFLAIYGHTKVVWSSSIEPIHRCPSLCPLMGVAQALFVFRVSRGGDAACLALHDLG